jgi:predicted Zn-dependent protease
MILLLFHDRRSLACVASLKSAIEECYNPYGLKVQESGYLYVPLDGQRLNAAQLLKYLGRAMGAKKVLWLVDSELFYPGIGPVLGCTAKSAALLYAGLEPVVLAKEALHEVGHLLGLPHCQHCVMRLSDSPERAKEKPSQLCAACTTLLKARQGRT